MKYLEPFVSLALLSVLLSCAVAFAQSDDPYTNLYRSPFSTYPDGSSRPLNPGPSGWNDDEYNTRKQQEEQREHRRQSQPSYELPAAPFTKDFNVWKDGKPMLCTATK